jgi:nucleoside-diphosphate-sugar epimerase
MKRAIVTGATGFIGRHLLEKLLGLNIEIIAVSHSECRPDFLPPHVIWISDDLSSSLGLSNKIKTVFSKDIDAFYHLAWNGVSPEYKNDLNEQIKNLAIGLNALYCAKECGARRFVNLGTVAEYVACDGLINEKWTPSPADIYGATKVAVRYMMDVIAKNIDQNIIFTILCSTFGEYRADDNVVSYTIKKLLRREKPLYGDLEQMWDFLYVKDVVNALYLIAEKGMPGSTYSIGSGIYRHLYEYVQEIRNIIDPSLPIGIGEIKSKYEKVLNSCVDSFLLQKDTGFMPLYSFRDGIIKTIEYFKASLVQ